MNANVEQSAEWVAAMPGAPELEPQFQHVVELGEHRMPVFELLRHLAIFGSTGCGKTRKAILPLLRQLLCLGGDDAETKPCLIVIDAKGDMLGHLQPLLTEAGREDDLQVIGDSGSCTVDVLAMCGGDPVVTANLLIELGESQTHGSVGDDAFWRENNRRLITHAIVATQARVLSATPPLHAVQETLVSLAHRRDFDDDDDNWGSSADLLEQLTTLHELGLIAERQFITTSAYLRNDVRKVSQNTWSIICNYAQNFLAPLIEGQLASVLRQDANGDAKVFCAEQAIDRGGIILVNLSPVIFGGGAVSLRSLIKSTLQQAILRRRHLGFFDGEQQVPINQVRPIYYVADEFHTLITNGSLGDAFFFDRARESRCGCIVATQGISAIAAVMRSSAEVQHFLNNCATKLFMSSDCPTTGEFLERLAGPRRELTFERQRTPARPLFRLPDYEFLPAPAWITTTCRESGTGQSVSAADLKALEHGEAFLISSAGIKRITL